MFEFSLTGAELAFRRQRKVMFQIELFPSQTAPPFNHKYMLQRPATETSTSKREWENLLVGNNIK